MSEPDPDDGPQLGVISPVLINCQSAQTTFTLSGSGLDGSQRCFVAFADAFENPKNPDMTTACPATVAGDGNSVSFSFPPSNYKAPRQGAVWNAYFAVADPGMTVPPEIGWLKIDPVQGAGPCVAYFYEIQSNVFRTLPTTGGYTGRIFAGAIPDFVTQAKVTITAIANEVSVPAASGKTAEVTGTIVHPVAGSTLAWITFDSPSKFSDGSAVVDGHYNLSCALYNPKTSAYSSASNVPGTGVYIYTPLFAKPDANTSTSVPTLVIPVRLGKTSKKVIAPFTQTFMDPSAWLKAFAPKNSDQSDLKASGDEIQLSGVGSNWGLNNNGTATTLLDQPVTLQLVSLSGIGPIRNGTPLAVRVSIGGTWRCVALDAQADTFISSNAISPQRWTVTSSSPEWPNSKMCLFGIYRIIGNASPTSDNRRHSMIDTDPTNEIMLGVDRILLVPQCFSGDIDPYFVSLTSAALTRGDLTTYVDPSQTLFDGESSLQIGFHVDKTLFSSFVTAYIDYAVPDATAVAQVVAATSPSTNELIRCHTFSSIILKSGQHLLLATSAQSGRANNIWYRLATASQWKPLFSDQEARKYTNLYDRIQAVEINPNTLLFVQRKAGDLLCFLPVSISNGVLTPLRRTTGGSCVWEISHDDVLKKVMAVFNGRFGTTLDSTKPTDIFSIIYDSFFAPVLVGNILHIFSIPAVYRCTLVHLALTLDFSAQPFNSSSATQFMVPSKAACLAIYGSYTPLLAAPVTEGPAPLLMVGGMRGSPVSVKVDGVSYKGNSTLSFQFATTNGATQFSCRLAGESSPAQTFPLNLDGPEQTVSAPSGSAIPWSFNVTWTLNKGANRENVVDGDLWLGALTPWSPGSITPGSGEVQKSALLLDTGSAVLARTLRCSFDIAYVALAGTTPPQLTVSKLVVEQGSTPSPVAEGSYAISADTRYATLGASRIMAKLGGTPSAGDHWTVVITDGQVQPIASGTSNKGTVGGPRIIGSYDLAQPRRVKLTFAKDDVAPSAADQNPSNTMTVTFSKLPNDNSPESAEVPVVRNSVPIKDANGKDTTDIEVYQSFVPAPIAHGLIVHFPANGSFKAGDTWTFDVAPAFAAVEAFAQLPAAVSTDDGKVTLAVPTFAQGRMLLARCKTDGITSNLETCSLSPFGTRVEPVLVKGASGSAQLRWQGTKSDVASWSDAVQAEVRPAEDANNQSDYGYLGASYRGAFQGIYYTADIDSSGSPGSASRVPTYQPNDGFHDPPRAVGRPSKDSDNQPLPYICKVIPPQYRARGLTACIAAAEALNTNPTDVAKALADALGAAEKGPGSDALNLFGNVTGYWAPGDIYLKIQESVQTQMLKDCQAPWCDADGKPEVFLTESDKNHDFLTDTYDPTNANPKDYGANVGKSLYQYMILSGLIQEGQASWDPAKSTSSRPQGTDFWSLRLGAKGAMNGVQRMLASAQWTNVRNAMVADKSKTFFPDVVSGAFAANGGVANSIALILMDDGQAPSFQNLDPNPRYDLVTALASLVVGGGSNLINSVISTLAGRGLWSGLANYDSTGVDTGSQSRINPGPPPTNETAKQRWDDKCESLVTTMQGMAQIAQPATDFLYKVYETIANKLATQSGLAARDPARAQVTEGSQRLLDSPSRRSYGTHSDYDYVRFLEEDPRIENPVASQSSQGLGKVLSPEEKANVDEALARAKMSGGAIFKEGSIMFFEAANLALQIALVYFEWDGSSAGDRAVQIIVIAVQGAKVAASLYIGIQTIRLQIWLRAGGTGILKVSMKWLDKVEVTGEILGGVLNVAMGVLTIMAGVEEGVNNWQGRMDVAGGSLMVAGGILEAVSAVAAIVPGVGTIIAGIGIEMGIIKIWCGGRASVSAFGENILKAFGDNSLHNPDNMVDNLVQQVKYLAIVKGISREIASPPSFNPYEATPWVVPFEGDT